jgi:hypothetical protein
VRNATIRQTIHPSDLLAPDHALEMGPMCPFSENLPPNRVVMNMPIRVQALAPCQGRKYQPPVTFSSPLVDLAIVQSRPFVNYHRETLRG